MSSQVLCRLFLARTRSRWCEEDEPRLPHHVRTLYILLQFYCLLVYLLIIYSIFVFNHRMEDPRTLALVFGCLDGHGTHGHLVSQVNKSLEDHSL